MTRLAASRGARPRPTPVARGPVRSLEAVALENAVVGCVVETYAAVVAEWQAEHATDRAIGTTMETVARDEARHATLAWRVHEWLLEQLPREASDRVQNAMIKALQELTENVPQNAFADRTAAGLPTRREGRALARALQAMLVPGSRIAAVAA